MSSVFLLVIGAVIVAVVAFLLRKAGGGAPDEQQSEAGDASGDAEASGAAHVDEPDEDVEEDDEDDEEAPDGFIAVSSHGWAFVPHRRIVLVTSAREVRQLIERQRRKADGHDHTEPAFPLDDPEDYRGPIVLQQGDVIATRVVPGDPEIPWWLETLGRDRDLTEWGFETEEAARAAQDTLERKVVRPPFDAEGEPIPIGDEDFWAAEQERMRTVAELDAPDEPDGEPLR